MITWDSLKKIDRFLWVMLFLGILLVILSYFILFPWFQFTMMPDYFSAGYQYNLRIAVQDATISNVSLLIPLPVMHGTPQIGSMVLTPSMFEQEAINASFIKNEDDWFVKITADTIIPSREEFEYEINLNDRKDYSGLPYLVNTRFPEGNESVFLPKSNLTIEYPVPEISTRFGAEHYYPVVSKYQIPIYAVFTLTKRTDAMRVMLTVSSRGYNSWVEQYDSWLGNNYWDEISLAIYDEGHGWYLGNGKLKSGEGIYLDRNAFKTN